MTPRESVLLRGLVDWVALDRIHWDVAESIPDASLAEIQSQTLELIRELVDENLCELGEVGAEQGFTPWTDSLDKSLNRIQGVYVDKFDDKNLWPWFCWLNLTERGEQLAQRIEAKSSSSSSGNCH